ncbi:MAG: hypothetical protein LBN04_09455 [Oscillospiraceae bacterium]|jgi:hypothetical protein|nr:hypothetical protein [Oscillospiraceae bacterium]
MVTLFLVASLAKAILNASVVQPAGISTYEIITLIFTGALLLLEALGLWLSHRKRKSDKHRHSRSRKHRRRILK